jgi:hypothetical protein
MFLLVVALASSLGRAGAEVKTTDADIAAMGPTEQAALLQPLRRIAGVLDAQGRAGWTRTYAGVELDAADDAVDLFTTDATAGRSLLAAGRRAAPDAQWARVRLLPAAYSREELDAAAARVVTGPGQARLRDVSVSADGAGLRLDVVPARSSASVVPAGLGVATQVRPATAVRAAKSWSSVKWHDSPPFIGGDVLTANGHHYCTAGLPAVRRSDHVPVMITAAHCFSTGQRVYTAAGTPGAYGNGRRGRFVGVVGSRNKTWDAELLTGRTNNADESDTTGWKPLTSVAYSYVGDYVCHDGQASFYLGHPTPCGIKVTDDDIWFPIDGDVARGVEGVDVRTGWGCHNGDSGATVFAVEPNNDRQARGIISSGGLDGTPDQKRVDWTEAVDIFKADGLELNPQK